MVSIQLFCFVVACLVAVNAWHWKNKRTRCKKSCVGLDDGNYQSCVSCYVYASCVYGTFHDNRPCAPGTMWDDILKTCSWVSQTCSDSSHSHTHGCITSCSGLPDGDYQSCTSCSVYASCVAGNIYDNRPCAPAHPPSSLVWDDIAKECRWTSRTCAEL